jgi:hypothetical protein
VDLLVFRERSHAAGVIASGVKQSPLARDDGNPLLSL